MSDNDDNRVQRMLAEYGYLRQELESNRKFIFERPVLVAGVILTLFSAMKGSNINLDYIQSLAIQFIVLSIWYYNLWFTFNRLVSACRIVTYIMYVHEENPQRWVGWETSLYSWRINKGNSGNVDGAYNNGIQDIQSAENRVEEENSESAPKYHNEGLYGKTSFYTMMYYFQV